MSSHKIDVLLKNAGYSIFAPVETFAEVQMEDDVLWPSMFDPSGAASFPHAAIRRHCEHEQWRRP